jgi:hypothetical protein
MFVIEPDDALTVIARLHGSRDPCPLAKTGLKYGRIPARF